MSRDYVPAERNLQITVREQFPSRIGCARYGALYVVKITFYYKPVAT